MSDDAPEVVDVVLEDEAWTGALAGPEAVVRRAALAALGPRATRGVVVLLSGDAHVRALNSQFRGKDTPTNVLSFPAPGQPWDHLGDVVLASGVCTREAGAQGKALADHVSHLVVHGVLHLLGYDHLTDAQAEEMESLERRILSGIGIPDPYASGLQGDVAKEPLDHD
jgi:probable rRNA maturation factor